MGTGNGDRVRIRYLALDQAVAGMVLAQAVKDPHMRALLPGGTVLTEENIHQLQAHGADVLSVTVADNRAPEEIAEQVSRAARDVLAVFHNADVTEPAMAALFDRVLAYRSA